VTNGFGTWLFLRTAQLAAVDTEPPHTRPLPPQLPGERPLTSTAQKWLGFSSPHQVALSPPHLGTRPIQAESLSG